MAENTEFYANAGRGFRDTDANAFTRSAPGEEGDERSVPALYPNGFTPRITSNILDQSISAGVRHSLNNGWTADFSHSYGYNNFHYFIKGTNNASLGSRYFKNTLAGINVAFGTEYRTENFTIFAGEEGSYATYDESGLAISNPATQTPYSNEFGQQTPGGSQGFPGYSPTNEVDKNRSNYGVYGDVEVNVSDAFLIGGALRFENYSDFGSTFNYKAALRYKLMEALSARASFSSGFRAPSLTQIHYNLVFNNIIAGRSERTLLASNTSTVAIEFGIEPLKEEVAQNLAIGLTYSNSGFTACI